MAITYKFGTITHGSVGEDVRLVQKILFADGFRGIDGKVLAIDGEAGDNTMHAIRCYIEARAKEGADLGSPDGWGPKCWADQNWPKK